MEAMRNRVVITLTITGLAVGSIYFLYRERIQQPRPFPSEITSGATSTASQGDLDLSPAAIAQWPTCRNEKYGYEFKYPKGWHIFKYTFEGEMRYVTEINTCDVTEGVVSVSESSLKEGFSSLINLNIETSDTWSQWVRQFSSIQEQHHVPYLIQSGTINGRNVTYYYNAGTVYAAVADGENMAVLLVSVDTGGKPLESIPLDPSRPERILLGTVLSTLKLKK